MSEDSKKNKNINEDQSDGYNPLKEGYRPVKKGYSPNQGKLDPENPPKGGSGVSAEKKPEAPKEDD